MVAGRLARPSRTLSCAFRFTPTYGAARYASRLFGSSPFSVHQYPSRSQVEPRVLGPAVAHRRVSPVALELQWNRPTFTDRRLALLPRRIAAVEMMEPGTTRRRCGRFPVE